MSHDGNSQILSSKQRTQNIRRRPCNPQNEPFLVPDLPLGPALEVIGSKDALRTAKGHRLNAGRIDDQFLVLSSSATPSNYPSSVAGRTQDSDSGHAKRMQTRVALRDHLKSPHHFQVVSLSEAHVSVQREAAAAHSSRSASLEKRKTIVALRGGHPEEASCSVSIMLPSHKI